MAGEAHAAAGAAAAAAAVGTETRDRVGLGFRAELAASILIHAEELEVIEVIAEDWWRTPKRRRGALRTLARQLPLWLHGVSLGLAGPELPDSERLDAWARLLAEVEPVGWSEHLAFVRGGGHEIGHLAMPPLHPETVESVSRNVRHAQEVAGSCPALENVATLVRPPWSVLDEPQWLQAVFHRCAAPFHLDLHNLYTNARNLGRPFDQPSDLLDGLPLDRVRVVHLAGGRSLPGTSRILDDHQHEVPEVIWPMLEALAARTAGPLDVIIERDGSYPPFDRLLAEVSRARAALRAGRACRDQGPGATPTSGRGAPPADDATQGAADSDSSCPRLPERWAARLAEAYQDEPAMERFLAHGSVGWGLLDEEGMRLAAASFQRKREGVRRSAHGVPVDVPA